MRRGYQFRCAMPVWGIDIFERSRTFFVLSSPTNWRRNADERNPHKGVSGKVTSRSASARLDDGVFIDALQRPGSGAVCPLALGLAFRPLRFHGDLRVQVLLFLQACPELPTLTQ